ncbi:MAG: hypothetical protein WCP61_09730 [Chitinophagia bacterium]
MQNKRLVIKKVLLILTLLAPTSVFAQTVYPTEFSNNQPLVYRDANGNYNGCGVRTVFMTDVPKPTHMGDVSMNIFKLPQGQTVGMAKVGYVYIPDIKDPTNTKRVPITSFMMANSSGKAAKMLAIKPSDDKDALISTTVEEDAFNFIVDITTGKIVQVGVQLPSEKTLRIFSMKPSAMSKEEADQLISCLRQIDQSK